MAARQGDAHHWPVTLIAQCIYRGVPMLFGDLAVTSPDLTAPNFHHPLTGAMHGISIPWFTTKGKVEYRFVRLAQKVVLIGDQLAVAWTGKLAAAAELIGHLRAQSWLGSPSRAALQAAVDTMPQAALGEATLLGIVHDDDRWHLWRTPGQVRECAVGAPFAYLVLAGSGELQGEDLFRQAVGWPCTPSAEPGALALGLAGYINASELCTGQPLQDRFGGGIETVVASGAPGSRAVLEKVDDHAALYLTLTRNGAGWSTQVHRFVQHRYVDGVLFMLVGVTRDGGVQWEADGVGDPGTDVSDDQIERAVRAMPTASSINSACIAVVDGVRHKGTFVEINNQPIGNEAASGVEMRRTPDGAFEYRFSEATSERLRTVLQTEFG